jgi:hypothetical protein
MKYIVTVATLAGPDEAGAGINLNQQVEAANVLDAMDKARVKLAATLTAGGLSVVPATSA